MVYSVRLYKNTGFNTINIPDSPALLDLCAYVDVPGIDVLQDVLPSVRVRTTWADVQGVDFAKVGDYYYSVPAGGIRMLSVDVAEVSLELSAFLTCGGINGLTILDGVTERAHVATDSYGEWTAEDPLLTPSQPLQLIVEVVPITQTDNQNSQVFVESTINLPAMAVICASSVFENVTEQEVTVPAVIEKRGSRTKYKLDNRQGADTGTVLYAGEICSGGIEQCRALGLESVVLRKFAIPNIFFTVTAKNTGVSLDPSTYLDEWIFDATIIDPTDDPNVLEYTRYKRVSIPAGTAQDHTQQTIIYVPYVDEIEGANLLITPSNLTYEYATVNNKRLLYGSNNRMGILTTAGNRLESNPEELIGGGQTGARITAKADPHPEGCPYYRFEYMNGSNSNDGFWLNAIKGLQWKTLPILWEGKSGSALDRISFENERQLADYAEVSKPSTIAKVPMSFIGALLGTGTMEEFLQGYKNPVTGLETTKYMERAQEARQFEISQRVVSPEVNLTYDCEAFRDYYGECIVAYRYRPTAADLTRMDKMLTMYGYRMTVPLEKSHFTNRQYFNYVKAGVTFSGSKPKWLLDLAGDEISGGVRVWHVLPDPTLYASNPIAP